MTQPFLFPDCFRIGYSPPPAFQREMDRRGLAWDKPHIFRTGGVWRQCNHDGNCHNITGVYRWPR